LIGQKAIQKALNSVVHSLKHQIKQKNIDFRYLVKDFPHFAQVYADWNLVKKIYYL
jgi:hypothetical protein